MIDFDLDEPPAKRLCSEVPNKTVSVTIEVDPSLQSNELGVSVNSAKGKWVLYDLDGKPWFTRVKDDLQKVLKHSNLFRLLSHQRVDTFLNDLRFDLTLWKTRLYLYKRLSCHILSSSGVSFPSLLKIRNIENLIVWRDDKLLENFLFSRYDAFDWNQLSLAKFLPLEDCDVFWGCSSTDYGRSKLCTALSGLELMCYVNYDECFIGVFDDLLCFLRDSSKLDNYQDLFVKYHLEVVLHAYSYDVSSQKKSVRFPDMSMSSPLACRELLLQYIKVFIDSAFQIL